MTIMVVDTDDNVLQKTAEVLTDREAAIVVVLQHSAGKAAEYAMCNAVDMVFTRAEMPDMSGEEMIKKIKFFQPLTEGYILNDGEEVFVTPHGTVTKWLCMQI